MLKGKTETTIPQRTYENIKTTYYFENEEEHKEAIRQSIDDCIKLNNIVLAKIKQATPKTPEREKYQQALGILQETNISGIQWRERKVKDKVFWEYWDKEAQLWKEE
ncbi:MAG: hypothetical protein H8D26_03635 [Methanomicrobia archaeon]|nr:hypothetical protein [Methanomicrobia archaeon]